MKIVLGLIISNLLLHFDICSQTRTSGMADGNVIYHPTKQSGNKSQLSSNANSQKSNNNSSSTSSYNAELEYQEYLMQKIRDAREISIKINNKRTERILNKIDEIN